MATSAKWRRNAPRWPCARPKRSPTAVALAEEAAKEAKGVALEYKDEAEEWAE